MDAAKYGDTIGDVYDELYSEVSPSTIETLVSLAGTNGRALELGIGTGRVALPLLARGVEVHGIDSSRVMTEKLRKKQGGEQIPVTLDDFTNVGSIRGGPFDLVFCAFNTFFALLNQEDQRRRVEGLSRRNPIRLAVGTRPHGAACRNGTEESVVRLGSPALRSGFGYARLGVPA